jgi:nucleoside-diphosphate-sugar epimerase
MPESASPGRIAVTGATGYVGGMLTEHALGQGWNVVSLRRSLSRESPPSVEERPFVLGEPVDPTGLEGVDALVHCAYDLSLTDPREITRVNVFGTLRLLDAAAAAGVKRVVLVSSMSAYPGTAQVYGGAKLASERDVLEYGGAAVRLGLVYGSSWGGMAGSLRKLLGLPVVPLMAGNSHQFTVHADDAVAGLLAIAAADHVPAEAIGLAHPRPIRFRRLLEGFARQAGIRPRFVPVPWQPVHRAMRTAERIGVPLPLRSDSLLGLVRPAPEVPLAGRWATYGVTPREFEL